MGGASRPAANSYGYCRFCELYRAWEGKLSPTMRQTHIAGERMLVDYAGTTIDIFDAETGEVHTCQLFVAVLGASSYTYAEATRTQALPDWIGLHILDRLVHSAHLLNLAGESMRDPKNKTVKRGKLDTDAAA